MGNHEGCLEQMDRLFRTKLYTGKPVPVDEKGRIAWTTGNCAKTCRRKWTACADRDHGERKRSIRHPRLPLRLPSLYGFGIAA